MLAKKEFFQESVKMIQMYFGSAKEVQKDVGRSEITNGLEK